MSLRFWKKKEYVPEKLIPERNDKEVSYNRKSNWELAIMMYVEAVFFVGFAIIGFNIYVWGFIWGVMLTVALCSILVVFVFFGYMWRKIKLSELIGKKSGIDLTVYNLEGRKYEDNFLIEKITPIASKEEMNIVLLGEDAKPLKESEKLFKMEGAFRKNRPLEEFMIVTNHKLAEHLEFNDTTTNFYQGAISAKKDVPSLSLKQIGRYGEHQLPLTRVDSSCVSRADKKLLAADLKTVLETIEAEDHWQAKELKKEIMGLEKTIKSQDHIMRGLLDKIERLKMRHEQIDEVGEDDKKIKEPTLGEKIKSWLGKFLWFVAGALTTWLIYALTGVI